MQVNNNKQIRDYTKEVVLETKFGTLYLESLKWDRHNKYDREEEDRIKVYDSNHNYLDYWCYEILLDECKDNNILEEEAYEEIITYYLKPYKNLKKFLNEFGIDYDFIGTKDECYKYILENWTVDDNIDLDNFEWSNRIGDYYILIREY